jgi:hypothetical protein
VALGLAVVLIALVLVSVWVGQRGLIYFPQAPPLRPVSAVAPGATDARFRTEDGLDLRAWYVPAEGGPATGAVLVLPGNAGSREFRVPLARALARRGLAVLLVDYRGYGGNPGSPTEPGLLRDARAAERWLRSRPGVDPDHIVYFGESLGAAVAIALALERPPSALVLRSPFTSLVDVARVHYPWLPVALLLRDRYPSIDRIGGVECPLLVIAGERDAIVPERQSRRLFEAAGHPAKRFVSIREADHNDPRFLAGETVIDEIVGFLAAQAGFPSGRFG